MSDSITYQQCDACDHVWYFVRSFCPKCGTQDPIRADASGTGIVHAVTIVDRGPTPDMKALAPYTLIMVDADEGFRMMAHGEPGLNIDERVTGQIVELANRSIPFFKRA